MSVLVIERSKASDLGFNVACELGLPAVAIGQQLLLIVEQLLMVDDCGLVVGPFDDGVDGTGLLAEATVDALGHIDIVAGGPPGAVGAGLALDGDGVGGTGGGAEFAGNAPG